MAIVVQKFGGSSVADVGKIAHVAERVARTRRGGDDVVVVVSAMGKTTDELLGLSRAAATAGLDGAAADPPRRELDMLLSTGERVSMALLSIALHARGVPAISFTGSQSGILTNDRHFDARIIEVRPHRIEDELSRGKVVIVAGYQGMSYRREITTLGRGGSDTTAVALAAALGAERCEIYSDVDGVYSADPRVVPEAKHLPQLDLAMLQEMAEAGAKVMNAQAVEWARRHGIALHARRTMDADGSRETVAREAMEREGPAVTSARAVVGMSPVARVRAPRAKLESLADAAAALGLTLLDVSLGESLTALVPLVSVPDWARCRAELTRALAAGPGGAAAIDDDRALVSLVGDGLTGPARTLPRFLNALRSASIGFDDLTATPLRVGAVIPHAALEASQRVLHAEFVPDSATSRGTA
jgi:aspartate kinase